ncbi:GH25 family lysozyme [Gemmatimonadota bacterium]
MLRKILIGTGAILGIGVIAWIGYQAGFWRINYPDKRYFPVRGIDVSHHQGNIDWDAVARGGFDFVYIKATEGGDFVDDRFVKNWSESQSSGLIRGAYHFFTLGTPGEEQALNFLNQVPPETVSLPPVIDFEFAGNTRDRLPVEEVVRGLLVMADALEAHYGKKPILYVTRAAYREYLIGQVDNYDIWIRQIVGKPDHINGKDWLMWQFADNTRVNGIHGPVDQNVFNGVLADLRALVTGVVVRLSY